MATGWVGPEDTVVWCSGKSTPSVARPHHPLTRPPCSHSFGRWHACVWSELLATLSLARPFFSRLPSQLFFSSIPPFVVATFNCLPPTPTVPESVFGPNVPCTVIGKSERIPPFVVAPSTLNCPWPRARHR